MVEKSTSPLDSLSPPVSYLILLLPLVALVTGFFFDGLFLDKAMVHGDAAVHSYPAMGFLKAVLDGSASALWTDQLYGGHPIYAEGQYGLFHPLNLLVASVFPMTNAQVVFQWLSMIIMGAGVLALCRSLGLSALAALFACLVVVFSGLNIGQQQNITISGTLAWMPWAYWALERWLVKPRDFVPLAVTMALMFLAGYPQIILGAAIYMALSLTGVLFSSDDRRQIGRGWRAYLAYGLLAVAACIGLAAVQLLPQSELAGLSHRSDSVEIMYGDPIGVLRGFLYAPPQVLRWQTFEVVGSVLVCVLASLVLVVKPSPRIIGHGIASLIMLNLGFGPDSPLFVPLYDWHLIPGLHFFRVTWPYFAMGMLGMGVLAAAVLDGLPGLDLSRTRVRFTLAALAVGWLSTLYWLHMPDAPVLHYALAATALLVVAVSLRYNFEGLIAPALVVLLVIEIVVLKLDNYAFYDRALLAEPASAKLLKQHDLENNYRMHDLSTATTYAFLPSHTPSVKKQVGIAMAAISPSTNILWGIRAMDGALALPQSRRMLIHLQLQDEIQGRTEAPAGLRLIDMLSIRYVAVRAFPAGAAMQPLYRYGKSSLEIVENTAALPRFQTYTAHQFVDTPQQAQQEIQQLRSPRLILEHSGNHSFAGPADNPVANDADALQFELIEASAEDYLLRVTASQPGWLFLADANYPGWLAYVDGQESEVYSAQVLGKAVHIPKGEHEVRLQFRPLVFRLGLGLSLLTLLWLTTLTIRRSVQRL